VSTTVFLLLERLETAAATQGILPLDKRAMPVLLALTKTCLAIQRANRALKLITTLTQQLLCVLHVRPTLRAVLSTQKTPIVSVTEGLQDLLEARVCNVHWASSRLSVALLHVLNAQREHTGLPMRRPMAIIAKHVRKIRLLYKKMAI